VKLRFAHHFMPKRTFHLACVSVGAHISCAACALGSPGRRAVDAPPAAKISSLLN
jgi:hypothetical protein